MRNLWSKLFTVALGAVLLYGGMAILAPEDAYAACNCPKRCRDCPPEHCICGGTCNCCACAS
jgi:hypothetical protein